MNKLLRLRWRWAFVIFIVLNTICVALGMGVPIFCILLGFFVGIYIARKNISLTDDIREIFKNNFIYALITCGVTLVEMITIWGPTGTFLLNPGTDYTRIGIPMILFNPKISFIGWLVLMVVISPFLQFLMTLLGSNLILLKRLNVNNSKNKFH